MMLSPVIIVNEDVGGLQWSGCWDIIKMALLLLRSIAWRLVTVVKSVTEYCCGDFFSFFNFLFILFFHSLFFSLFHSFFSVFLVYSSLSLHFFEFFLNKSEKIVDEEDGFWAQILNWWWIWALIPNLPQDRVEIRVCGGDLWIN